MIPVALSPAVSLVFRKRAVNEMGKGCPERHQWQRGQVVENTPRTHSGRLTQEIDRGWKAALTKGAGYKV
jgi:hypothetical protein